MKRVGVREFRDHATQYLSGDDVLAVERHGEPIGFYIPTRGSQRENFGLALDRLDRAVKQVLADTGLSEDQLSGLFDVKSPLTKARIRPLAPAK